MCGLFLLELLVQVKKTIMRVCLNKHFSLDVNVDVDVDMDVDDVDVDVNDVEVDVDVEVADNS